MEGGGKPANIEIINDTSFPVIICLNDKEETFVKTIPAKSTDIFEYDKDIEYIIEVQRPGTADNIRCKLNEDEIAVEPHTDRTYILNSDYGYGWIFNPNKTYSFHIYELTPPPVHNFITIKNEPSMFDLNIYEESGQGSSVPVLSVKPNRQADFYYDTNKKYYIEYSSVVHTCNYSFNGVYQGKEFSIFERRILGFIIPDPQSTIQYWQFQNGDNGILKASTN